MKPLIADMHMHTLVSGHAYGTIREMAADAAERKLQLIGITEHGPGIPGTCNPTYFLNFGDAPKNFTVWNYFTDAKQIFSIRESSPLTVAI